MKAGSTRGIALINALIVVAAISAVSIALLARAERATHRLTWTQDAVQADRYLEAAELLVQVILDRQDGNITHLGEDWAQFRQNEPIDRGTVTWELKDLQGRFNINRMIGDGEDAAWAREIFFRLAVDQGLSAEQASLVIEAFSPSDIRRDAVFGGTAGRSWAPPLPLRSVKELALIVGLNESDLSRLAKVVSALPPDAALNVNTVLPEVMAAFLPGADNAFKTALEARQAGAPFHDVEDFLEWLGGFPGLGAGESTSILALSVDSQWFEAKIGAVAGAITRNRSLLLNRAREERRTSTALSVIELNH